VSVSDEGQGEGAGTPGGEPAGASHEGVPEPHEVVLRDGTRAWLRPIRPDDKDQLQRGLRELSPEGRFARFHTPVERLSEAELCYLTEIDHVDHAAWVAIDQDAPDQPGMGVGRYVRLSAEPHVAEAAITVVDRYQGLGLGRLLLELLARHARVHGITTFRNYVLSSNRGMIALLQRYGAHRVDDDDSDGVYWLDMRLPGEADADLEGTSVEQLLRQVAKGSVRTRGLKSVPWRDRRGGDAPCDDDDADHAALDDDAGR